MNYFLRVFCQKSNHLLPEEVIEFIENGFFFDHKPNVTLEKEDDRNWEIKIFYDIESDPVIISTYVNDKSSQKEIEELKFVLNLSRKTKKIESISKIVGSIDAIYTLQINQDQVTDDCWEMLDATESMIMNKCNGVLFTSDNEFFDKRMKRIYKL